MSKIADREAHTLALLREHGPLTTQELVDLHNAARPNDEIYRDLYRHTLLALEREGRIRRVDPPRTQRGRWAVVDEPPVPGTPAPGALYVTTDGTAYRCREYRPDPWCDDGSIRQSWVVNYHNGATSTAYAPLPADATLIWTPAGDPS